MVAQVNRERDGAEIDQETGCIWFRREVCTFDIVSFERFGRGSWYKV